MKKHLKRPILFSIITIGLLFISQHSLADYCTTAGHSLACKSSEGDEICVNSLGYFYRRDNHRKENAGLTERGVDSICGEAKRKSFAHHCSHDENKTVCKDPQKSKNICITPKNGYYYREAGETVFVMEKYVDEACGKAARMAAQNKCHDSDKTLCSTPDGKSVCLSGKGVAYYMNEGAVSYIQEGHVDRVCGLSDQKNSCYHSADKKVAEFSEHLSSIVTRLEHDCAAHHQNNKKVCQDSKGKTICESSKSYYYIENGHGVSLTLAYVNQACGAGHSAKEFSY